jgi:hypothetical protein
MSNRRLNTNISFGKLLIINATIIRREVGEAEELSLNCRRISRKGEHRRKSPEARRSRVKHIPVVLCVGPLAAASGISKLIDEYRSSLKEKSIPCSIATNSHPLVSKSWWIVKPPP